MSVIASLANPRSKVIKDAVLASKLKWTPELADSALDELLLTVILFTSALSAIYSTDAGIAEYDKGAKKLAAILTTPVSDPLVGRLLTLEIGGTPLLDKVGARQTDPPVEIYSKYVTLFRRTRSDNIAAMDAISRISADVFILLTKVAKHLADATSEYQAASMNPSRTTEDYEYLRWKMLELMDIVPKIAPAIYDNIQISKIAEGKNMPDTAEAAAARVLPTPTSRPPPTSPQAMSEISPKTIDLWYETFSNLVGEEVSPDPGQGDPLTTTRFPGMTLSKIKKRLDSIGKLAELAEERSGKTARALNALLAVATGYKKHPGFKNRNAIQNVTITDFASAVVNLEYVDFWEHVNGRRHPHRKDIITSEDESFLTNDSKWVEAAKWKLDVQDAVLAIYET
jgi:hypothetical protein